MATMTKLPSTALLIAPTAERWRAMSLEERESYLVRVLDALSDPSLAMSEGRPHKKAKSQAIDALGLYFRSLGRDVYLGEEMAVVYPGEPPLSPDLLAVVDVAEPEDDARLAWVVADEGRGLDWVLEVLHRGDRNKDLVENVERYAALGIPEYFVYDRRDEKIHGYRLPSPDARRYQRIVPQYGRHRSSVLGLDLGLEAGRLKFFHGTAELIGSSELIDRLHRIAASLEAKADRAQAEADRAEAETHRAQAEADRAQAEADRALEGMRLAVVALLGARGLACPDGSDSGSRRAPIRERCSDGSSERLRQIRLWQRWRIEPTASRANRPISCIPTAGKQRAPRARVGQRCCSRMGGRVSRSEKGDAVAEPATREALAKHIPDLGIFDQRQPWDGHTGSHTAVVQKVARASSTRRRLTLPQARPDALDEDKPKSRIEAPHVVHVGSDDAVTS